MSKRKFDNAFSKSEAKLSGSSKDYVKKHTLDSDEEDFVDEDNVLNNEDIEGEEEGIARQDGEQKMTAFNMNEEMEEGHFDKQGHFIWKNEKEIRDNWLDNIDWQKITHSAETKDKYNLDNQGLGTETDSEEESDKFDAISSYKKILTYLKPNETINKALKRLGGADMKLSSVERLKRKKAGTLNDNKDVTDLTEIANNILTNLGNMDVYQETYEEINAKIEKSSKRHQTSAKEAELDMYADDFDVKEKEKIGKEPTETNKNQELVTEKKELMWEFKWKIEDETIHGPFSTQQMIKWVRDNYFKDGVMVRKYGEQTNFYTSNRIDFELYE